MGSPSFAPADIRNIVLAGQAGAGKTTLVERLLFDTKATTRMGSVEEGNTVSDFTDLERHHKHSLATSVMHLTVDAGGGGKLINILDTAGLPDYLGHTIVALPAGDILAIVIDAAKGVEPVTRRLMAIAAERKLPRMIIVNKIDDSHANLEEVTERIRSTFGNVCLPINLPTDGGKNVINVFTATDGDADFSSVEEAHKQIIEQVVETDEGLMMVYLEQGARLGGGGLEKDDVHAAFEKALREGHLVPICFTSAKTGAGVADLVETFIHQCPNPTEGNPRMFLKREGEDGAETEYYPEPDPAKPLVAHVFKLSIDPFVGKLGVFRVHQGTIRVKEDVYIDDHKKPLRIGHMFRLQGKDHVEVSQAGPGEIVAVAKVEEIHLNGTLHSDPDAHIRLKPLPLPQPMYGLAIELKNHADESKFGGAVAKLAEEDPCFRMERIAATKQTVLRGLGEMHLRFMLERLKQQSGIELNVSPPKVAYKETITTKAEGHHRHKKQTGGAGQFGEVYLRVIPLPQDHPEGFEFENATVGGSIPRQFMPAIEKGVRQVLADGAIAGYPMQGIRVEVYDGKYHPVDSKEVAFVTAGKRAFIDAVSKAKPVLLEPFVDLEIIVPASHMGDIAGDLSGKRGRVQDTEMLGGGGGDGMVLIRATAPLGEVQNYSNELKSMTGGQGSFNMDYSHDEQAPPHVQQEVVAAFKGHGEED